MFDVDGVHPNISPTHSTPQAGFDYACKDGDAVAGGLGRPDAGKIAGERSKWHDIMDAESREEFYQLCMELDPRSLCISFGNIEKFLDWRYREDPEPYQHPEESSVWRMIFLSLHSGYETYMRELLNVSILHPEGGTPPELRVPPRASLARGDPPPLLRCAANTWIAGERGQSLCLWGPSRNGKTIWARSLGAHAYFGGLFSLSEPLEGVTYAVFDDINGGIQFFPQYKWWLGHQRQFYATDKYKGKKLIHWGKPAIWVSNDDPREQHGADRDWLEANVLFVYVDRPLTKFV